MLPKQGCPQGQRVRCLRSTALNSTSAAKNSWGRSLVRKLWVGKALDSKNKNSRKLVIGYAHEGIRSRAERAKFSLTLSPSACSDCRTEMGLARTLLTFG